MQDINFILKFAAIGISIVFVALTFIATAITLIRKADEGWQAKEKEQADKAFTKEPTLDSTTLVLITAACATVIGGKFHIRRVRRLRPKDTGSGPWALKGRSVLLGSHMVDRRRK